VRFKPCAIGGQTDVPSAQGPTTKPTTPRSRACRISRSILGAVRDKCFCARLTPLAGRIRIRPAVTQYWTPASQPPSLRRVYWFLHFPIRRRATGIRME